MKLSTYLKRGRVVTVSILLTFVTALPYVTHANTAITSFPNSIFNPVTHQAGTPVTAASLPIGVLRQQIEALPTTAQTRALNKLSSINFSSADLPYLRTDRDGGIYIEDHFDIPAYLTNEPQAIDPLYQNITSSEAFSLHSKPGAAKVIYLDFNGHVITGTAWNGNVSSYNALPYDLDGNANSFSANELASIAQIWRRTAEDFAPFDVDVTTEEPATFTSNTGRALITKNVDANNISMPASGAGGVAYVGVWGWSSYQYYSPALVYYNNLSGGRADIVTEALSHEMGHNLGLGHDGTSSLGYYGGHGTGNTSWGPIMGTGYNRNVSQWSKGEYTGANNQQDDVNIIAGYLNHRMDDHSDTSENATPIVTDGTEAGNIVATTPLTDPANFTSSNKGIIETQSDADTFQFDTTGGTVTLNASSFREASNTHGGNLDIEITLRDSLGVLVEENAPTNDTNATVTVPLAAGRYYLTVKSDDEPVAPYSNYGSLGQYFLSGNIPQSGGGNDTTPDAFTFSDQTDVAVSSVITSAPITISGINTAANISVSGGEYSINGGAYTTTAGTVSNAASVTVRHTSSANHATNTDTVLTIGGVVDTFSSTTLAATPDTTPDTFTFTDQTNVALSTAIVSAPISVNGINTAANISVSGGEYSINGGAYTTTTGTVNNAASVTVRHTSSANHATNTDTVLTIGGVADTFTSTTLTTPVVTHTLNVTKTGTGAGTVTSTPAGINCGTDCTETYPTSGKIIKLTAIVGTNSLFTGWSGACSGTSTTCNVTVTNLQNVTANFNYITYNLTITKVGNGTISSSPSGIDCGADCTEAVNKGSTVTLTATPDTGYKFTGWTGGCTGTATTCTVTMSAAKTVTATFKATFPLTVSKTGTGTGRVAATGINCDTSAAPDCTETYIKDAAVTITATATAGSRFTGWSGACSGTTCSVTMNEAKNVTANFDFITFNLAITKVGNGSITSNPAGIDCGADCTEAFRSMTPATAVTLTATPDAGYKFISWTGGCSGTATTCTVTMSAAKTVTATFKAISPLTVSKTGTGTGRVAATGINCDTSATPDCTETYIKDARVTLTATATAGSRFTGWLGAACTSTTCSVTMNEAKNVTANFDLITFNLTVAKVGNGSVTSNPTGIDCGTDCAEAFRSMTPATAVTLTATPDTGYKFTGWTGGCTGTATTCTVTMSAAKTVTATFKATFPLTVTKTGTGTGKVTATNINCDTSVTPDCTETYLKDTRITLTATATAGSRFTGWSGACTGTTCSVTMNEAKNVTANFDFITFNLAVTKVGNGSVTSNPTGIDCGADCAEAFRSMTPATAVTLTATPDAGYKFSGWTGGCTGTATACTVTMSAAKTVTATFRPIFTLTVNKVGTGTGTVTSTPIGINCGADCTEDYLSGTAVTLTARAATGSRFTGWSGSCAGTSTCRVTLSAAAAAVANFVTP